MIKKISVALVLVLLVALALLAVQQALDLEDGAVAPVPRLLGMAVMTYFVTLSFMALRLWLAMGGRGKVRFAPLLDMTLLHNFLMVFLPARMGDGYYPFLIAARTGRKLGAGVGNLVLLRLLDVTCIAINLCIVLPWVIAGGVDAGMLPAMLAGLMLLVLGVIANLTRVLEWAASGLLRIRTVRGLPCRGLLGKAFRLFAQARNWNRGVSLRARLALFSVSLFAWFANVATYYLILTGLGLDLTLPRAVFAGQLAEIGGVLPLQTVAGIGASEGILAGVLAVYGMPLAAAAVLAVWVRLSILGGAAAIFAVRGAILAVWRLRRRAQADAPPSLADAVFGAKGVFTGAVPGR